MSYKIYFHQTYAGRIRGKTSVNQLKKYFRYQKMETKVGGYIVSNIFYKNRFWSRNLANIGYRDDFMIFLLKIKSMYVTSGYKISQIFQDHFKYGKL